MAYLLLPCFNSQPFGEGLGSRDLGSWGVHSLFHYHTPPFKMTGAFFRPEFVR